MTAGEPGELRAQPGSDRGTRAVEGIVAQVSASGERDHICASGQSDQYFQRNHATTISRNDAAQLPDPRAPVTHVRRKAAAPDRLHDRLYQAQTIYADDYRGAEVVFRGQVRVPPGAGLAGLFLRIRNPDDHGLPLTEAAAMADPTNHIVTVEDRGDWSTREVAAQIPADTDTIVFGVFLAGPGQIQLRGPELTPGWAGLLADGSRPAVGHDQRQRVLVG